MVLVFAQDNRNFQSLSHSSLGSFQNTSCSQCFFIGSGVKCMIFFDFQIVPSNLKLGGDFKYFRFFTPKLGEGSHFDLRIFFQWGGSGITRWTQKTLFLMG